MCGLGPYQLAEFVDKFNALLFESQQQLTGLSTDVLPSIERGYLITGRLDSKDLDQAIAELVAQDTMLLLLHRKLRLLLNRVKTVRNEPIYWEKANTGTSTTSDK